MQILKGKILQQILERYFVEKIVKKIRVIPGGRVNDIFYIHTLQEDYIIKIQRKQNDQCKQQIGNEVILLDKYYQLHNLIPKVYHVDLEGNEFGKSFVILQYIDGESLENKSIDAFYNAGKSLARVHMLQTDRIGQIQFSSNILSLEDIENYYRSYFEKTLDSLRKIDVFFAEKVTEYIEYNFSIQDYKNQKVCLLHNDVHLKNIMVTPSNDIKFIDWDCAKYAHSEIDFIKIKHLIRNKEDLIKVRRFYEGYQSIRRLELTHNFQCHEIIWLSKMIIFETYNYISDHSYFPPILYYKEKIDEICKGNVENVI